MLEDHDILLNFTGMLLVQSSQMAFLFEFSIPVKDRKARGTIQPVELVWRQLGAL
jgi:hypothetical protein